MSGEAFEVPLPKGFADRVVAWQRDQGRHGLPWQGTRDAYRIWLSEIMLQQTQVSTVLRYYEPFLMRFPTVQDLAQAPVDEVLAAWSGLGYYSRARNLHRCAQAVLTDHAGVFPTQSAVLESLPGIGRSTAAAVAAFSSGERAAILDGNVKRVLTRVLGFGEDVARPQGQRRLWNLAESLLPQQGIEAYTQGLMDLGATVCLQRRPQCGRCPVRSDCAAHAQGRMLDFPVKVRRVRRGVRSSVLGLFVSVGEGRALAPSDLAILMWRRPAKGVWAGLWSLPEWANEQDLERLSSGSDLPEPQRVPDVVHALTHLDWTLQPRRFELPATMAASWARTLTQAFDEVQWVRLDEALQRGLPAPVRRLIERETERERGRPTGAGPDPDR